MEYATPTDCRERMAYFDLLPEPIRRRLAAACISLDCACTLAVYRARGLRAALAAIDSSDRAARAYLRALYRPAPKL